MSGRVDAQLHQSDVYAHVAPLSGLVDSERRVVSQRAGNDEKAGERSGRGLRRCELSGSRDQSSSLGASAPEGQAGPVSAAT